MRRLLTPAEVASLFAVDVKTVVRWANAGKLPFIRTLGGHRRYPADQIHALLGEAARDGRRAQGLSTTASPESASKAARSS